MVGIEFLGDKNALVRFSDDRPLMLSNARDRDLIVRELQLPGVVKSLHQVDNEQIDALLKLMQLFKRDENARILSSPGVAEALIDSDDANARKTLSLIKGFNNSELQTRVLEQPNVVQSLTIHDLHKETLEIIRGLNSGQRTRVLSADCAVKGLVDKGRVGEVLHLITTLPKSSQRASVLAGVLAVESLAENGVAVQTAKIMEELSVKDFQKVAGGFNSSIIKALVAAGGREAAEHLKEAYEKQGPTIAYNATRAIDRMVTQSTCRISRY